jgi:4-aminobutyrate aminotransferase
VTHAPYPDPYRPILNIDRHEDYGQAVVHYIEHQLLEHLVPPDHIAGILIETIQGEGGYIVPPPNFFPALRELCDRHGILLIVDEVQCGMGRTGKMWAIEHFGVEPDIVCSAKGIASGMPLGVMFAREHIMDWPKSAHGNTFGGNPLACAAALATIELLENGYLQNTVDLGLYAKSLLEGIMARHPSIGQVRGLGLMLGVEFVQDRQTKEPAEKLRDLVIENAFKLGLLLLGCGKSTIRIAPPLSVSRREMEEAMAIFEEAIRMSEEEVQPVAA